MEGLLLSMLIQIGWLGTTVVQIESHHDCFDPGKANFAIVVVVDGIARHHLKRASIERSAGYKKKRLQAIKLRSEILALRNDYEATNNPEILQNIAENDKDEKMIRQYS